MRAVCNPVYAEGGKAEGSHTANATQRMARDRAWQGLPCGGFPTQLPSTPAASAAQETAVTPTKHIQTLSYVLLPGRPPCGGSQ